jgi:Cu2+-exporting ATPase
MPRCDHCLLEFPERDAIVDDSKGERKVFCCHGCRGVYLLINNEGLDEFYRRRRGWAPGPVNTAPVDIAAFTANLRPAGGGIETDIVLDGIRCASCVWLNEKVLTRTPGVTFAQVNYATHRARIRWDPERTGLETILRRITSVGYTPKPFGARTFEEDQRQASRDLLIRFGTAAFLSMQLMIYAAALYAGYFQGIDPALKDLFHWIALVLTTPVVLYAGWPFLAGALRGIRHRSFTMDVLIAAGSGSAYLYSIYQIFAGGEVFFDTAAMIITLILLGRYLEAGAKRRASETIVRLLSLAPQEARRVTAVQGAGGSGGSAGAERRMVPVANLLPGDHVEVIPGEKLPLDGVVREGTSETDESMLTGESLPVAKGPGSEVFAGTVNLYGSFIYEVTRTGGDTVLSRIIRAVEDAQSRRAPVQAAADRIVGWFVPVVVLVSAATAAFWLLRGAGAATAMMNAVSVMVIACPCALGLATPLAILTGTTSGASRGILIKGGDVIERAKVIDTVVFDKTGTITEGRPKLINHRGIGMSDDEALLLAAALERRSEHSVGRAIVAAAGSRELPEVREFSAVPGKGVRGVINGRPALIGSRAFAGADRASGDQEHREDGMADRMDVTGLEAEGATIVYLSYDGRIAGVFAVADEPRPEAAEAVRAAAGAGLLAVMITGDAPATAQAVAQATGIGIVKARRTPVEKAEDLRQLRASGRRCAMVGDGINDAPALVEADVGIAMGRATDIALESADMVLMRSDLRLVPQAIGLAKRTFSVIRQNLFWAFLYNVVTIPLAVMGMLHPIVAAGAMALSSLSVVGNSLRARAR